MKDKMIELALSYISKGWSVLPCGTNKVPLVAWKQWQTRYPTESEVRGWFEMYPHAQIGIITGQISNLTVVDVEKGGDPSFLPQDTMIVQTGGMGFHYFYLYEEGVLNKARIRPLCDLRSEGGYVVAPGSVSEKGPYTIIKDVPLLPFPKDIFFKEKVDIFRTPETSSFSNTPIEEYQGFNPGQRNDEMARYIGYILTRIHPLRWDSEAWNIIQLANNKNRPPLPQKELKTTFESIKRLEVQNNPFGHRGEAINPGLVPSSAPFENTPIILDDDDGIKHLADVADDQKIDQSDVYPLEMSCFDEAILGGVSPGDLVVISGQTGQGKTSLSQDWTISLIRGEKKPKALWFSYEVLPTHLWNKFQEMGATREDCVFIPSKHTSGNISWVEEKIKEGKEKFEIKIVMIDHLGFLLPKTQGILGKNMSSNYATFLTQVARDLKVIALKEEVIIFLPVHMKKTDSKQSDLNDIKDSSGISQEADLVFLIERERNKEKDATTYFTDKTIITLAKNRKTGLTVIGNFSMINGRFAYEDRGDLAKKDFEQFGKKEEEVQEVQTDYYNKD